MLKPASFPQVSQELKSPALGLTSWSGLKDIRRYWHTPLEALGNVEMDPMEKKGLPIHQQVGKQNSGLSFL